MGLEFVRVAKVLFDLVAACFGTPGDHQIVGNFAVFPFAKLELHCLFEVLSAIFESNASVHHHFALGFFLFPLQCRQLHYLCCSSLLISHSVASIPLSLLISINFI